MSSYQKVRRQVLTKTKINQHSDFWPPLPLTKYSIIYCDPPWDYNGKLQFDRSSIKTNNPNWIKNIFICSAAFKYPTIPTTILKTLPVAKIADENCLLFMWSTNPHLKQAIALGEAWGLDLFLKAEI